MPSIAAVANVFEEINALPGWLESASQFFDHITVYHTGPRGAYSQDGTIELCEKWGVDLKFGAIDDGFGVVRTKLITMTPCDWVMILDADERFHRFAPVFRQDATVAAREELREPPPGGYQGDAPGAPEVIGVYDQGAALRELLCRGDIDAIVTSRRHWQTLHWDRPCQSFFAIPDWQARILRNCEHIGYRADIRMHEQLVDFRTNQGPRWYQPTVEDCRVYHDHYHSFFKPMEPEQRAADIRVYDALHHGAPLPPSSVEVSA